jgi:hypothetical protein
MLKPLRNPGAILILSLLATPSLAIIAAAAPVSQFDSLREVDLGRGFDAQVGDGGEADSLRTVESGGSPRGSISQQEVRILRRNARQFEQFQIRNPENGQNIDPNTTLELPNGKKVSAREYYAQLNQYEQEFNKLGYSLREDRDRTVIQESIRNDPAQFRRQATQLEQDHRQIENPAVNRALSPDVVRQEVEVQPQINQQILQLRPNVEPPQLRGLEKLNRPVEPIEPRPIPTRRPLPPIRPRPTPPATPATGSQKIVKNWNYEVGNRSRFAAFINGKLELNGSANVATAEAEANAGGYAFDKQANILRATAKVVAPDNGQLSANLNLAAFGANVYNFNRTVNASIQKTDTFQYAVDKEIVNFRFTIGPIPMSAKFGVRGSAGLRYDIFASPRYAYAKAVPFLDTRAYGQGGADIVVGGAGVGVNLVLLKDELEIAGKARLNIVNAKLVLDTQFSALNKFSALNGNVYAYAFVYVPRFGVPPWKKKQWDWTIVSWNGFNHTGYFFNESKQFTL